MTILESKLHPIKFYLQLVCFSLFGFTVSTLLLLEVLGIVQISDNDIANWIKILAAILIFWMVIVLVKRYSESAAKIIIFTDHLLFNDTRIEFSDIEEIQLIGKVDMMFFLPFPMNGIRIAMNNKVEKVLYDSFYTNTAEIKQCLEQLIIMKKRFEPYRTKQIQPAEVKISEVIQYKGMQLFCFHGAAIWIGVLVFLSVTLIGENEESPLLVHSIIFAIIATYIFALSFFLNYFLVTDEYLVIKNHNWIWRNRIFAFEDIREVYIEEDGKWPKTLVVFTKDFRKHEYPASSLRKKQWFGLWRALARKKIKVSNLAFV